MGLLNEKGKKMNKQGSKLSKRSLFGWIFLCIGVFMLLTPPIPLVGIYFMLWLPIKWGTFYILVMTTLMISGRLLIDGRECNL